MCTLMYAVRWLAFLVLRGVACGLACLLVLRSCLAVLRAIRGACLLAASLEKMPPVGKWPAGHQGAKNPHPHAKNKKRQKQHD